MHRPHSSAKADIGKNVCSFVSPSGRIDPKPVQLDKEGWYSPREKEASWNKVRSK
jgi:hypothetical protein